MRIGTWATRFNVKVIRCEERPDQPAGEVIYRLKDLFTTRDGSWEPSAQPGSVEAWARDSYLLPPHHPEYFDDAGGDHNLFVRVLDEQGKPLRTADLVIGWSDGVHLLGEANFAQFIKMTITPKARSGWGNQPIWNSFNPEQGETGAWAFCPRGAADVVVGGGLPHNQHISWFAVWQAERRSPVVEPVRPEPANVTMLRTALWQARGIPLDNASTLVAHARQQQLGAPLTSELDVDGYRVQGFAGGIVFAPIGALDQVSHISW
ncbi:MAG: hypothetical protein KF832_22890 [Caldilineaceae bacterium]|nr:hypothetical protein [Caldilineaceae bacterium]